MPNSLTDNYDVLVHVRTKILNGLLANFHRNGGIEDRSPTFLHSFERALGGVDLSFDEGHLLAWVNEFDTSAGLSVAGATQAAEVSSRVPPGLSLQIGRLFEAVEGGDIGYSPIPTVAGKASVQVSAPRISFADGSTSAVSANMKLRARFIKHPDSVAFPSLIHGEIHARFYVQPVSGAGGKTHLDVNVTPDDNYLAFVPHPGVGMTPYDVSKVSELIREGLRNDFEPMSVELDDGFPFEGFKAQGSGSNQIVAVPVTMDGSPPPSGLGGLQNQFLHTNDDFGVAVSKEYVESKLQTMLGGLAISTTDFTIEVLGVDWATYVTTASSPQLSWKNGYLEVSVTGDTTTTNIVMPDYHWTVKQRLKLDLDTQTQDIQLVTAAPLEILGLDSLPSGQLSNLRMSIVNSRDTALANAQADVDAALTGDFSVRGALQNFHGSPSTELTAVEITTQGVIIRGQVLDHGTSKAQIAYEQIAFGAFSALWSWMPGGWIDRYLWSWKVTDKMYTPWGGKVEFSGPMEHSFRLPAPANKPNVAGICLQVEGTQTTAGGTVVPVEGGEACKISVPSWMVATMPKWYDLLIPIWEVDPSPESNVQDVMQGHINLLSRSLPKGQLGGNSVVHFVGDKIDSPLDAMSEALSPFDGSEVPIALTLVLPQGSFDNSRAALEKQLGTLSGDFAGWLMFTEDYDGGWTRAFAPGDGPETFAMNARGEFVWRHAGVPNRRSFAGLGQHFLRGCPLELHTLELGIGRGERSPDFLFRSIDGRLAPLRKFRGRRVELCFWKSWSAPCTKELQRLQRLHEESDGGGPLMIGVNGGEDAHRVEEVRRELGLTIPLVVDTQRWLTRQYDVHCWPTIVSLNEDGRVDGTQFGATRVSPWPRPKGRGADGVRDHGLEELR